MTQKPTAKEFYHARINEIVANAKANCDHQQALDFIENDAARVREMVEQLPPEPQPGETPSMAYLHALAVIERKTNGMAFAIGVMLETLAAQSLPRPTHEGNMTIH